MKKHWETGSVFALVVFLMTNTIAVLVSAEEYLKGTISSIVARSRDAVDATIHFLKTIICLEVNGMFNKKKLFACLAW